MNAIETRESELLGVFELDEKGTVLYSNLEAAANSLYQESQLSGANFFTEVAAFANVSELRRRFDLFRLNKTTAQSFDFTCQYADGPARVRILLARSLKEDGCSFLVHMGSA